jgi:hypothetical protein
MFGSRENQIRMMDQNKKQQIINQLQSEKWNGLAAGYTTSETILDSPKDLLTLMDYLIQEVWIFILCMSNFGEFLSSLVLPRLIFQNLPIQEVVPLLINQLIAMINIYQRYSFLSVLSAEIL